MSKKLPAHVQRKIDAFTAKHVAVKFDSDEAFKVWMKETVKTEIHLVDKGQDLIRFYIADNDEVVGTEIETLGNIYNGALLLDNPELMLEGDNIGLWMPQYKEISIIKYPVEKVIRY